MDKSNIRRIQKSYVDAAVRARDVGFDLIQVAAREGFSLPLQFLWRYWNHRTDEYGGSLENRTRFWRETLEQVREAVGDDCAIVAGFCLDSFNDTTDRAFKVSDDGVGVVEMLDDIVDLWDMQVGHLEDDVSSSRFFEPFWQRDYIEQVRPYAKKPIAAVGRFTDPELMARAVGDGVIDIIGAARPAISDPFIPNKIREGRAEDIRECIGCNMCVSRFNNGGGRIVCTQNATVGEEYRRGWHPEKFNPSESAGDPVLIIGAGPAGMECARVLGERGFEAVHLAEAESEIGGHVNWVSQLPGMRTWRRVVEYREAQLTKMSNVTVLTGKHFDVEDVLDYGASTVVIATGANWDRTGTSPMTHLPVPGADMHPSMVFTPEDVMLEKRAVDGDRVLVYDCEGYFMGSSLAQKLAIEGKEVTLVTPADQVGSYLFHTDEGGHVMHALLDLGVQLVTSHSLSRIEPGKVTGHNVYHAATEASWTVDSVVLVTQRRSRNDLYEQLTADQERLSGAGITQVLRIGDCSSRASSPRRCSTVTGSAVRSTGPTRQPRSRSSASSASWGGAKRITTASCGTCCRSRRCPRRRTDDARARLRWMSPCTIHDHRLLIRLRMGTRRSWLGMVAGDSTAEHEGLEMTLSLETGRRIARFVHGAADRLHLRPLTVVVLDSGGHVVVAERSDFSPIGRFEIARGKAYGALALGMNSRAIMERGELQPQFVASATAALEGRVIPVPGGVLVDDSSGQLVGAVGVSGDTSDNDEAVAMEAIAAAGLKPRGARA